MLLRFAIEGRKRVKEQLLRMDTTYAPVQFGYVETLTGQVKFVQTLEEEQYPQYFRQTVDAQQPSSSEAPPPSLPVSPAPTASLQEGHFSFQENQRGVSFNTLFGAYLKGAQSISITDAYVRLFFQVRNLMELLETIARQKADEDEVDVHLVTSQDEINGETQAKNLTKVQESVASAGIRFTWEYQDSKTIHARHIVTNHGWKILLDRGLDIFQRYEMNDAFSLSNRVQEYRPVKAFEVTFLKV